MLRKLISLFIITLFTCSALELEIAEEEQNFFDVYDTYIPARPVSVGKIEAFTVKQKITRKAEFKNHSFNYNSPFKTSPALSELVYIRFLPPHPPSTILLQKSELRV